MVNELNLHYFEVLENGDFYLFLRSYDDGITKEYLYKNERRTDCIGSINSLMNILCNKIFYVSKQVV